jgi:hypothetical protein
MSLLRGILIAYTYGKGMTMYGQRTLITSKWLSDENVEYILEPNVEPHDLDTLEGIFLRTLHQYAVPAYPMFLHEVSTRQPWQRLRQKIGKLNFHIVDR